MIGINPIFFRVIYLLIVAILTFFYCQKYSNYNQARIQYSYAEPYAGVIFLALLLIIFIGLRPVSSVFVDMGAYRNHYYSTYFHQFSWDKENIIFDNLLEGMAAGGFDFYVWCILISTIYFGCMAWACSELFPKDKMVSFLVYLGAFSTFSYGTNGMKAGAAASLFLVALAMNDKGNKIWTILFLMISWGFHHSMQLPVGSFILCKFVRNPKIYFALWTVCFLIAVFHIGFFQQFFASITDEHGAEYLLSNGVDDFGNRIRGFRIDFILYSVVPIVIGWIAVMKKRIQSEKYFFLLNLYTVINAVWMLCIYAESTNRIAYLSWQILPITLIYPFLREGWGPRQYSTFRTVAFCHLGFTLFMNFIYYA